MANIPCPNAIICPGSDDPFGNFSSEAPDPFVYRRFGYPIVNPNNPIGGDGPRIPQVYFAGDCAGVCVSLISQEDADLCAARQAYICSHTPPGGHAPPFFYNGFQLCGLSCGGGSQFFWTVPAGAFVALSQAAADDQALAYACEQAARHAFCLNDINTEAQTGIPYNQTIFIQSGPPRQPVTFAVLSGQLPPGLNLTPEGPLSTFLHGTPTQAGSFTFTIIATDAIGTFVTKQYTITVTSTCSDLWNSLAPNWVFTTLPPAGFSVANRVGNVVTVSAYVRQALDVSGLADASAPATVLTTSAFQCSLTVTPLAIVNAINTPALQILVQDQITAAMYLNTGVIVPLSPVVFNFNLPAGAKPQVTFTASVVNAGNGFDSQLAYSIALG